MVMSIAGENNLTGYQFTTAGLAKLSVGSKQYNVSISGSGTTIQLTATNSQTITHCTNIVGFKPDQIGCFAETTGELADVYGVDYVPTMDRATDAICKVRHCKSFTPKIVGIITDYNQYSSHGDILCRCVNDDQFSIKYEVGDLLFPDETGLCRVATHEEKLLCAIDQVCLPKITWTMPDSEFVGCFLQ
jgi:hypothetical protein